MKNNYYSFYYNIKNKNNYFKITKLELPPMIAKYQSEFKSFFLKMDKIYQESIYKYIINI